MTQNIFHNWEVIVRIAAAFVKPTITGCDRKSTITHSLKLHISRYTQAVKNASKDAKAIYHSVPLVAMGESTVAVISDTIVTGPVDICGDDPKSAAIITGIQAV